MAPPHLSLSWIHLQYAPLGFPRKPSVYCSGLPATVSAMIPLQPRPAHHITPHCILGAHFSQWQNL